MATWHATAASLERLEEAFAYCLLFSQGQVYPNYAKRSVVNEESVQNAAAAIMNLFGMNNTLGEDMVRQLRDAVG